MIQLKLRTEYSFRRAYGRIPDVVARVKATGATHAAITDWGGTWGHVAWSKECKKAGVVPLFGVELAVVDFPDVKKKQTYGTVVVVARTEDGMRELYGLVTSANRTGFYYYPRVGYDEVNALSESVIVLWGPGCALEKIETGDVFRYGQVSAESAEWNRRVRGVLPTVLVNDNYYVLPSDRAAYEILASEGKRTRAKGLMHVADEYELLAAIREASEDDVRRGEVLASHCHATLPHAEIVRPEKRLTLYEMCMEGARARSLTIDEEVYAPRLKRELDLIAEKNFEDYFYVITDMVAYAKGHMLVGPARGSSAGSLVCYLLGITDVDPIVHDLMFERFIDVTREDLPDIDIDFQDDKREMVMEYMRGRYGAERVGRIGTVMRYKAKSALTEVAKELHIPVWEMKTVSDAVIERSSGDARAQFCIQDALESLDVGKELMKKYPSIAVAGLLEGHARNSGKHAAGVMVSQLPVSDYCAIDYSGTAQIDKKDAETLNLLKIDALGLRTLSVIQDCLDQIGQTRGWLVTYPLNDDEAFHIFNADRFSGIFQYEGYALQSLTKQMKIREFNDVAVITALARPGPLHSGAATEFVSRRLGKSSPVPIHPLAEHLTRDTYGVVIYQEQVMAIGRTVGNLSWEDVSELRKAMSKSLGEEFFNRYWEKFREGAKENGIVEGEARRVWEKMCTFGSWAFNKSHAVSYGLLSYWCAVLKAHHPLEYSAACLRNAKDEDQAVKLLRDLVHEGFSFVPADAKLSDVTWAVREGKLVGGLTNIKGIGQKTAEDIISRRASGKTLTPRQAKLIIAPQTPYDDIFEAERRFGDIYRNPTAHNITSGPISYVKDINDPGDYVFIARIKEKKLRDKNEYNELVKRGGRKILRQSVYLNLVVEDDTGSIIVQINRFNYARWGKTIVETGKIGDWYIWKGSIRSEGWNMVTIEKWRKLEDLEEHPNVQTA